MASRIEQVPLNASRSRSTSTITCGRTAAIIFPNPNAPTGRLLPLAEIERLLQGEHGVGGGDRRGLRRFRRRVVRAAGGRYPQLLVMHTLSKSRSLAGLRVGYAIGHPDLIEALNRVKDSFNSYPLDRFAQAGAAAAMEDRRLFRSACAAR